MRTLLLAAATVSLTGLSVGIATSGSQAAPAAKARANAPRYGTFGFDATGMDRNVAPGQSFYNFSHGNWDRTTQIPADQANYGMFTVLADLSEARTRGILEQAAARPGTRMGDFYASFMNEGAIERAGITPIQPVLSRIKGLSDRSQWAAALGRLAHSGIRGPIGGFVGSDERHPDVMIVHLGQGGLGLPDRDYYLSQDAGLTQKRAAYQAYLTQLLTLAGEPNAEARAAAVVGFERSLAEVQWTRIQNRDENATYNRRATADFARNAPGLDWGAYFREAGFAGQETLLVAQPNTFTASARIVGEAPQAVLNDYPLLRVLDRMSPYLSSNFVDANFAFRGTTLN